MITHIYETVGYRRRVVDKFQRQVPEAWNQKNGIVTLRELRALRGEKTENVCQEAVEIITNI